MYHLQQQQSVYSFGAFSPQTQTVLPAPSLPPHATAGYPRDVVVSPTPSSASSSLLLPLAAPTPLSSSLSMFSARLQAKVTSLFATTAPAAADGRGGDVQPPTVGRGDVRPTVTGRTSLEEVVVRGEGRQEEVVATVEEAAVEGKEGEEKGEGGPREAEEEEEMDERLAAEEMFGWREDKEKQYHELSLVYHLWLQQRGRVGKKVEELQRLLAQMERMSEDIDKHKKTLTGETGEGREEGREEQLCVEAKEWLASLDGSGEEVATEVEEEMKASEEENLATESGSAERRVGDPTDDHTSSRGRSNVVAAPLVVVSLSELSSGGGGLQPLATLASNDFIRTSASRLAPVELEGEEGEEEGSSSCGEAKAVAKFISEYGEATDMFTDEIPTDEITQPPSPDDHPVGGSSESPPPSAPLAVSPDGWYSSPLLCHFPPLLPSTANLSRDVRLQTCLSKELVGYCLRAV
eukprot:GHVS01080994.1.p1 GENE.GHVS01080994.1~~GHVS01080994.1.p1  ORF type:complete len:464 (+),score=180.62 GHVS01080994.1:165-1556(+)